MKILHHVLLVPVFTAACGHAVPSSAEVSIAVATSGAPLSSSEMVAVACHIRMDDQRTRDLSRIDGQALPAQTTCNLSVSIPGTYELLIEAWICEGSDTECIRALHPPAGKRRGAKSSALTFAAHERVSDEQTLTID